MMTNRLARRASPGIERSGPWARRSVPFWVPCLVTLFNAHCGPDPSYLPSLAAGQLELLAGSVPIDDAISSGDLSDEQVAKLRLIQDVRRYARDTMQLNAGDSFTLFYDNRDATRSYNVSASRKDRFEPVTWTFPIVGTVPYLGFFDRQQADRQAESLGDDGFDVYMYEVDAYSTLGYLPNPVQAAMLRRGDISIVNTVIHELLHGTIWRPGDVTFNESLATFFGRTGALHYLRARFDDAPELIEAATTRSDDTDRYNAFILELYEELDTFYSSDLTSVEKIAGRELIYQAGRDRFVAEVQPLMHMSQNYDWVADLPANNAWMLGNYRYNLDLDLFQRVYDATGRDWRASLDVFRNAASADDPKAHMRDWLASPGRNPTQDPPD
ncbi:MAG: aminopeptidase [Phycisphaerae bacterium]